MCGTGGRRLGRVDGDAHQLRAGDRQLLDLDRGADRVDGVGVGHRLHAHRRVAADRDHARAPAHARLARAARRRARPARSNGSSRVTGRRASIVRASVYFSSRRATLSRVYGASSTGWPRKLTCGRRRRCRSSPRNGARAVEPDVLARLDQARDSERPLPSITSTHDVAVVRSWITPAGCAATSPAAGDRRGAAPPAASRRSAPAAATRPASAATPRRGRRRGRLRRARAPMPRRRVPAAAAPAPGSRRARRRRGLARQCGMPSNPAGSEVEPTAAISSSAADPDHRAQRRRSSRRAGRRRPARSRNGAFRPLPTCSRRWPSGGGSSVEDRRRVDLQGRGRRSAPARA